MPPRIFTISFCLFFSTMVVASVDCENTSSGMDLTYCSRISLDTERKILADRLRKLDDSDLITGSLKASLKNDYLKLIGTVKKICEEIFTGTGSTMFRNDCESSQLAMVSMSIKSLLCTQQDFKDPHITCKPHSEK